jgi:hypothetical protein
VSVLVGLEDDVSKTLQSIKKGIALLDDRRAELVGSVDGTDTAEDAEAWEDEEAQPTSPAR